ncbi:unnamed protein product [Rotaria socialis]|uniref:Uncharacterized protein n=1 Tax=Rotaria socialis TaxID=392032 RepID=A0A821EBQ7_9BILA|nr:unnamed protein product [Rotaria socialis]CAF4351698.1 unnamed protein product [Rotaria socialis]CAF4491931.1 unnamed protein product [Rotaria socialis]CAF4634960.1 unnamed protein product [Rotaria socialis]CAF4702560.1 unnamed protein product [Rotaria socialis]
MIPAQSQQEQKQQRIQQTQNLRIRVPTGPIPMDPKKVVKSSTAPNLPTSNSLSEMFRIKMSTQLSTGTFIILLMVNYSIAWSSILPLIMMAIVSSVLFFTSWTRDSFSVQVIGASLVTAGFVMIIGQYVLPNLDVHLSNLTSKIRRWFSNDHAYENIPPNQEEHEDFIFVNPI